jgi:transcriptional regulator with XRE-family HTH domain
VRPDDLLARIASNLRTLRGQRGISREQLGSTADVDPQMIKRIEHGRANPALVVLSRLASALTISASLLMAGPIVTAMADDPAEVEPFDGDTVGETLVALRRDRHLSVRAVATRAQLRAVTLSRYEAGAVDARILAVEPIAGALGVAPVDLVRAVEERQRQADLARGGWSSPAPGVEFRMIAAGTHSRLWEWRLAPAVRHTEAALLPAIEEIATAIRGDVRVELGDSTHRLRRGGSLALPASGSRTFVNVGRSTARLLRFQVTK